MEKFTSRALGTKALLRVALVSSNRSEHNARSGVSLQASLSRSASLIWSSLASTFRVRRARSAVFGELPSSFCFNLHEFPLELLEDHSLRESQVKQQHLANFLAAHTVKHRSHLCKLFCKNEDCASTKS